MEYNSMVKWWIGFMSESSLSETMTNLQHQAQYFDTKQSSSHSVGMLCLLFDRDRNGNHGVCV